MVKPYQVLNAVKLNKWSEVSQLADHLPGWVFRGQRERSWWLEPYLERECVALGPSMRLRDAEEHLLSVFRDSAMNYLPQFPDENNFIEWLGIIQHYGGPTRLIDFTTSIHVAAFFALEEQSQTEPVIWAINEIVIRSLFEQQLQTLPRIPLEYEDAVRGGEIFNALFSKEMQGYLVGVVAPAVLHERLIAQKGLFLCSLNTNHTFVENLFGMFDLDVASMKHHVDMGTYNNAFAGRVIQTLQRSPVIKMILDSDMRVEALVDLAQRGITSASLFPGLDGSARSLKQELVVFSQNKIVSG
jgi:hypothetical protein